MSGLRDRRWREAYESYRSNLGRGILLGLELLVGADIIFTITAPFTWQSVGLLAGIVVIRTFLSFSLEAEIEGCWPWQRAQRDSTGRTVTRPFLVPIGYIGTPIVSDCNARLLTLV